MGTKQDTPDDCVCIFRDSEHMQLSEDDLQEQCGVVSNRGYICTRPPGHEGYHVACGNVGEHYIDEWDDV